MSSSTSSSRRRLVVAATVIATLLGIEWVTRHELFRASKDLRRFSSYPERARRFGVLPGRKVVFIGNSLTERGIDPALFGTLTGDAVEMFVADGSHINTWYWMVKKELWREGVKPDLLVLDFYETSLEDGKRLELGRLAQFFTEPGDWGELFASDVTTLDQRADFLLSSVWATFAVRERIKERVLGLIPGYQPWLEAANAVNFQHESRRAKSAAHAATRNALTRFIARAKEHGVPVLFVAFPSQGDGRSDLPYEVPEETLRIIAEGGMRFLDLRKLPALEKRHYADDVHLTPEGQAIYTRQLASAIAARWPGLLAPR